MARWLKITLGVMALGLIAIIVRWDGDGRAPEIRMISPTTTLE